MKVRYRPQVVREHEPLRCHIFSICWPVYRWDVNLWICECPNVSLLNVGMCARGIDCIFAHVGWLRQYPSLHIPYIHIHSKSTLKMSFLDLFILLHRFRCTHFHLALFIHTLTHYLHLHWSFHAFNFLVLFLEQKNIMFSRIYQQICFFYV